MKTFALVAVLCLALASAYPYYNDYNNYNSRYMGMGQYYNNPYQYGGMSGYNMMGMGRGSYMGYDSYRYPYMNRNYGNYGPYSSNYRSSRYGY